MLRRAFPPGAQASSAGAWRRAPHTVPGSGLRAVREPPPDSRPSRRARRQNVWNRLPLWKIRVQPAQADPGTRLSSSRPVRFKQSGQLGPFPLGGHPSQPRRLAPHGLRRVRFNCKIKLRRQPQRAQQPQPVLRKPPVRIPHAADPGAPKDRLCRRMGRTPGRPHPSPWRLR